MGTDTFIFPLYLFHPAPAFVGGARFPLHQAFPKKRIYSFKFPLLYVPYEAPVFVEGARSPPEP